MLWGHRHFSHFSPSRGTIQMSEKRNYMVCGFEKHTFVTATSGTAAAVVDTANSAAVFVRRHSDTQLFDSISQLRTAVCSGDDATLRRNFSALCAFCELLCSNFPTQLFVVLFPELFPVFLSLLRCCLQIDHHASSKRFVLLA
jgi:hypothetical protein